MVSRGRLHQCDLLPGFYVEREGRRTALLTYRCESGEMEVVALYVEEQGRGDGSALLEAAADVARDRGCRRVWLVTTNDNEPAIRFYRNRGMRLAAVHHGAVDAARRELKPEIPLVGVGGAPIRDEIEFEIALSREVKTMKRIEGVPADSANATVKEAFQRVEKAFGSVPEPLRVTAHSEAMLQAYMGFERYLARAGRLDAKLKSLANLKTAALIGCPF
jgi:hypothetical protein